MNKYFCIFFFMTFSITTQADDVSTDAISVSEITSIYDGDTFTANIKDWPSIIGERIGIRINGVDTPELRGRCKEEIELARNAKQFTVNTLRNAKSIELINMKRDKYFRIVADVIVDGINLGQALLRAKLAIPYEGGKKSDWCV